MQRYSSGQQTRTGALSVRFADGITRIHIPAIDLERVVVWYVTRLGCDLVDCQPGQALLRAPGGPQLVLWACPTAAPILVNGLPCAALRLQGHDLAALSAYLHGAGCVLHEQSDQTSGQRVLRLQDPSGYMLLIGEDAAADLPSARSAAPCGATKIATARDAAWRHAA